MSKDKSNSSVTSSNKRKRKGEDNQSTKAMFHSDPDDSVRNQKDKTHDSFIEYLNYNVNRSSMAEESLLLSPIPGDLSRRSINSVRIDMRTSTDTDALPKSITKRSRPYSGSRHWTGGSPGENSLPKSMNRMLDTSACISLGLGSSLDNTSQSDSDVDWNSDAKASERKGRRSSSSFLSSAVQQEKTSFEEGELSYDDNSDQTELSVEEMEGQNIQNSKNEEDEQNPSGEYNKSQQPIQSLENDTYNSSSIGEDKTSSNDSEMNGSVASQPFLMSPPASNKSNTSKTPGSGDKTVRFTPDTKNPPSSEQDNDDQNIIFSSPDKSKGINSIDCSNNGLTPRLQALKAKLIRDTAIANQILASSSKENESKTDQDLNENVSDDTLSHQHEESTSPSSPCEKDTTSPEAYKIDSRLSLTPFLKAAKERLSHIPMDDSICPSTSLQIEETSLISSNVEHSWGSFTPLSQEKSKRTLSIRPSFATIGEEDSYLDQSNDLSSAKKNLNAQSSALLLKVKGAAQRRMQLLAKSRDSLAAKENKQVTRNTMPDTTEESNAARRVELNGVQRMKVKINKESTVFKAKPMPDFSIKARAGASVTKNKSVTKPLSPNKLGPGLSQAPQRSRTCDQSNDEMSFKAKVLPRTNVKPSQLPKVEKRPLTVAKSPVLGSRRTNLEKPRSLRRPASVPRNFRCSNTNKIDSPVGLHFVGNVVTVDENIPLNVREPFVLHSTIRAQKRSEFDKNRVTHEIQRQHELKLQRERILKDKYRELDGLKDALR